MKQEYLSKEGEQRKEANMDREVTKCNSNKNMSFSTRNWTEN